MSKEILIACVGKPSAGKSSFLNSISDASAKVGNYPFTTIEPNKGVAFVQVECPCKRFKKESECNPRQGKCVQGTRSVPLQFLDVAGLVPGASKGEGLGNQFLNDLTQASCLIHVVDVSGTTDAGGKVTVGYDPINDIDWLHSEIHSWMFQNLYSRWLTIQRRHVATKSTIVDTLQAQMGGYGTSRVVMNQVLDKFNNKTPLETWDQDVVKEFINVFLEIRFPTIIALNKIDLPESDKNIERIMRKYDQSKIVLISALAENFLRKMHKQNFITYYEGTDGFETAEDVDEQSSTVPPSRKLNKMDEKTKSRLERVQDLVLFRYGNTGVQECLQTVLSVLGLVPVFPVKNINNFGSSTGARNGGVFRDCFFVRPGTTFRQVAHIVSPELDKHFIYAEIIGSIRVADDDVVTKENNIMTFRTSRDQ